MKRQHMMKDTLAACLLLLTSCFHDSEWTRDAERVRVGEHLPEMELLMEDSTWLTTKSLLGNWVVMVLFSVKCSDCRKELPEVQRFYDMLPQDASTKVVAVSRAEGRELVAPFWQELTLSIPYSAQTDDQIFRLFADHTVPRIYIANPQGIVVATFDDTNMPSAETLASIILELS